jgi:hypothetical protein
MYKFHQGNSILIVYKCKGSNQFSIKIKYLFSMSTGSVKGTRLMARLRMGLSGLNGHRNRFNFIDHSRCPNCNYQNENLDHYFFITSRVCYPQKQAFPGYCTCNLSRCSSFLTVLIYQYLTKRKILFKYPFIWL